MDESSAAGVTTPAPDQDVETGSRPSAAAEPTSSVYGARSLSKSLNALIAVASANEPLRLSQLQRKTRLPKSTLFRILRVMTDYGILAVDPSRKTYGMGPRLFEIAHKLVDKYDLIGAAAPELRRLSEETGEAARLCALDGLDVVVMDLSLPPEPVPLVHGLGARIPIHRSAAGLAMVAQMPREAQNTMIARIAAELPREASRRAIQRMKSAVGFAISTGFAIGSDDDEPGVREVAATITDEGGNATAAISAVCSLDRVSKDQFYDIGRRTVGAGRNASADARPRATHRNIPIRPRELPESGTDWIQGTSDSVGGGPCYDERAKRLYWVDVLAPALNTLDLTTGKSSRLMLRELTGAVGLTDGRDLIAGGQSGFQFIDPRSGSVTSLADPEFDNPGSRFQVGKIDPAGRYWAASMVPIPRQAPGRLYSLEHDCQVTLRLDGINAAKGLAWSPDARRFYLTQASAGTIHQFDFDIETGHITKRRVFAVHRGQGTPNGLAVDEEGGVWAAIYGGWRVHRYRPDGTLDRSVPLPVPLPTNVAFGGPRMSTLFVTSSRLYVPPSRLVEAPLSGGLFRLPAGVRGLSTGRFPAASLGRVRS